MALLTIESAENGGCAFLAESSIAQTVSGLSENAKIVWPLTEKGEKGIAQMLSGKSWGVGLDKPRKLARSR